MDDWCGEVTNSCGDTFNCTGGCPVDYYCSHGSACNDGEYCGTYTNAGDHVSGYCGTANCCCNFPEEHHDCDGNCTTYLDCAGVCNGSAVDEGCGCNQGAPNYCPDIGLYTCGTCASVTNWTCAVNCPAGGCNCNGWVNTDPQPQYDMSSYWETCAYGYNGVSSCYCTGSGSRCGDHICLNQYILC